MGGQMIECLKQRFGFEMGKHRNQQVLHELDAAFLELMENCQQSVGGSESNREDEDSVFRANILRREMDEIDMQV